MSRIRTSLHGRQLGIDHNNRLLAPNGIVLGNHGNQVTLGGPDTVSLFDDFVTGSGASSTSTWLMTEGTDSATSFNVVLSEVNGVLRLSTGDAGTGFAADAISMTQNHTMWVAENGGLVYETRIKLSAITTCYAFVGFTDTVSSTLEQPINSAGSANTLTSTATDAVGFMFDTGMTDDNWWLVGVDTGTDATHQDTGYAPVAGTYEKFRIEIDADGTAVFFRNGLQVGTPMTNAVAPDTLLTPIQVVSKLSVTATMNMAVDYVHVSANRA